MHLVCHSPFSSVDDVIQNASDLRSQVRTLKKYDKRILVKETDIGKLLTTEIEILKRFLREYYHYVNG